MTLNELLSLQKANPLLFKQIVGISVADFQSLVGHFAANKAGDKTRKYPDPAKVLLIILTRRFQLKEAEVRGLFFPSTASAIFNKNLAQITQRFDAAFKNLNRSRPHNELAIEVLIRPAYLSPTYTNLDELLQVAELSQTTNALVSAKIRLPKDQSRLAQFLKRPLAQKSKKGQDNFLQLVQHLLRDLQEFDITKVDTAIYITTVLHLFNHNASHEPYAGAGKAVTREVEHSQEYYRSQSKHTHAVFFKRMTTDNLRKQCIMPRNATLQNIMINETNIDTGETRFITRLQQYDANGYAENDATDTSYFTISLAHSGLRTSNSGVYQLALTNLLENMELQPALRKLVSAELLGESAKRIPMCNVTELNARINYIHELFRQLPQGFLQNKLLLNQLHAYRYNQLQKIVAQCSGLKNINVHANVNSVCLFIDFYPTVNTPENSNYTTGVTNVLIGFLGGLINFNLDITSIEASTQRRQSFGMHWSTLTDMGKLKSRLSIGIEASGYAQAVINSLKALDELLNRFDFTNPKCPLVKAGFVVTERGRSENITGNEGIRFLTEMRSPDKRVQAIRCAQKHLHLSRNNAQGLPTAFSAYLDDVTHQRLNQPQIIPPVVNVQAEQEHALINEPLFVLLANAAKLVIYTIGYLEDSIEDQPFKYSYYHIVAKLYGYCEKTFALLNDVQTETASHAYALGRHLLEHLLEYLTQLDCLKRLQIEEGFTLEDQIEKLTEKEEKYTRAALNLEDENCYAFYTDSGQSASIATLYSMTLQLYQEDSVNLNDTIFVDSSCYFELNDFLRSELKLKLSHSADQAEIVFTDVLSINHEAKTKYCKPAVKLIILDVTHQPSISEGMVNDFIRYAINKNKWVALTSSLLKNEQLGLDKYQCGKIIIIAPAGKELSLNVCEELQNITANGITPIVASYFRMLNKITREKQYVMHSRMR